MNLTPNVTGCTRLGQLALLAASLLLFSGCTGGPRMAGLRSLRNKPEEKQATGDKEETASFRRLFEREPAPATSPAKQPASQVEQAANQLSPSGESPVGVQLGSYTRNPKLLDSTAPTRTNPTTQLVSDRRLREKPADEDPFLNIPASPRTPTSAPPVARRETPAAPPTGNNQFVEGFEQKLQQLQQEVAQTENPPKPASQAAPFPEFENTPPAASGPFPETAVTRQPEMQPQPSAPQETGVFRLGPPKPPVTQTAQATPQAPGFPEESSQPVVNPAPSSPAVPNLASNPRNPFEVMPVPSQPTVPGFPGITSAQPDPTFLTQKTPRHYPLEANGPSPNDFAQPGPQPVITSRNEYLSHQQEQFAWQQTDNQPRPAAPAPRSQSLFPEDWEPAQKQTVSPAVGTAYPDDIYPSDIRRSVHTPPVAPRQTFGDSQMITSSDHVPSRFNSPGQFARLDQGWKSTEAVTVPASELEEPARPAEPYPPVRPAQFPAESPRTNFPVANQSLTPASQTPVDQGEWGDHDAGELQATPVEQLKLFVPQAEPEGVVKFPPMEEPAPSLHAPAVVSLNPFEDEEPEPVVVAVAPNPSLLKGHHELPIPQAELETGSTGNQGTVLPRVDLDEPHVAEVERGSSWTPWLLGAILLAGGVGFLVRKRMLLQQLQSTPPAQS